MTRTKKVFISDIHLGTEDSANRKYGWFWKEKAILLGQFLTQLANDNTLAELVIVGDLFDEWVVPFDTSPTASGSNQFSIIAAAPQNQPVIAGLKQLIATPGVTVYYVPGNHDMLIQSDELTKKILPGIKPIIDSTVTGKGVYQSGSVYAEHGSFYDLFNAPDVYDKIQGATHHLPVGFYVARSQAQGVINGNPLSRSNLYKDIKALWDTWNRNNPLVTNIYNTIAKLSNTTNQDIVMSGLDGIKNNVKNTANVTDAYGNVYDEWDQNMPGLVNATAAAIGACGELWFAALLQYYDWFSSRIVLFGHTHAAEIRSVSFADINEAKALMKTATEIANPGHKAALEKLRNLPETDASGASGFIYVNTGTWITGDSGVPDANQRANYAVIEQQGTSTYASLYNYNGTLYAPASQIGSTYYVSNASRSATQKNRETDLVDS